MLSQIEKEIYIAGWFSGMKIVRLFLYPDILKFICKYPITGRKGAENYAIYRTGSRAGTIPIPDYVFEAILEERKVYEKNRRRWSGTFQDLDDICCSTYGRPRSKDFYWRHYKKLLEDNGLPGIRWHDLRSTFCTILLKNNFNPKAVSQLMGHAKEIITMDVYADNRGIIADGVQEIKEYMKEVLPNAEETEILKKELLENVVGVTGFLLDAM